MGYESHTISRPQTRLYPLLALLALNACGGSRETAGGAKPQKEGAHPAPGPAVERCIATLERLPTMDSAVKVKHLLEGCSQIFAEAGCRDAWAAAAVSNPSSRYQVMVAGCREAYCKVLSKPKPALCSVKGELDWSHPVDRARYAAGWHELIERALVRDLGPERSKELAAEFAELGRESGRPLPRLANPGPPAPEQESIVLDAKPEGAALRVVLWVDDDEHGSWKLATPVVNAALAGLGAEARRHAAAGKIVLRVDPTIEYEDLVAIMNVLYGAGFHGLSFAVTQP